MWSQARGWLPQKVGLHLTATRKAAPHHRASGHIHELDRGSRYHEVSGPQDFPACDQLPSQPHQGGVTALGANLESAIKRAYEAVDHISFEGMFYRKDIGHCALARLQRPR